MIDHSTIQETLATRGLTLAQEREIEEAITRHEAMQTRFAWGSEHDHEAATLAYMQAEEIEAGVFRKYEIDDYTPIEQLGADAVLGETLSDPAVSRLIEDNRQATFEDLVRRYEETH